MGYDNERSGHVVFDLETVASPKVEDLLDPVKAPGNYKDPMKIAAFLEEKRFDQVSKAGLEPDLCEIVAVGLQINSGIVTATREDTSEAELIYLAWNTIGDHMVIGFNILSFDLPVLIRRSQLLGIPVPAMSLDRYRSPHIDLLERLSFNGKLTYRSLAFYCRLFGVPCEDTTKGADIAGLVTAGDWTAVERHVRADVEKTAGLAQRLGWLRIAQPEMAL